jgi:glycosyltransferase involved in cell wall biosynthesis
MASPRKLVLSAWRALPFQVRRLAHVASQKALRASTPLIVRMQWRRSARQPGARVAVVGLFRSTSGLGQGGRLFTDALEGRVSDIVDVTERLSVRVDLDPIGGAVTSPAGGEVILSHLNPPELARLIQLTWGRFLKGRRHIGYWAWELPVAPTNWRQACDYVDEIWTPSEFTARSIRAIAGDSVPVRVAPHPVAMMPHGAPNRTRFGLPDDAIVVLAALDLRSTIARKNPLGALDAYRAAAAKADRRSLLVCKVSNFDADLGVAEILRDRLAGHDDVLVIDESLSTLEMSSLIASSDIVLSMHRAEGFGLIMAEGMWLGKPVIATGWSGNMDFMDADSSVLVPYALVPVDDMQSMYSGSVWAEPDIGYAASRLAWLIDSEPARASLGHAARQHALRIFDPTLWRRRIDQFLDAGDEAS